MTPVTIDEARDLGKRHGIDRLVIFAVNHDGKTAYTSYGKDRATCRALKRWIEEDDQECAPTDVAISILNAR